MRILSAISASALAMLVPGVAMAAGESTIGDRLVALVDDVWNPVFLLAAVGFSLAGIFMFARGLMKLVAASQPQGGGSYASGLTSLVIAAALIAIPDMAGMGMTSLLGSARGGGTLDSTGLDYSDAGMGAGSNWLTSIAGAKGAVGKVDNCLLSDTPAACMAKNIATNVVPMAVYALFAGVFIFGFFIFANSLIDIAKSAEPNNQQGRGVFIRIMSAILLMNAPVAFTLLSTTLFGADGTIGNSGLNAGSTLLTYSNGSSLEIVKRYTELIGHAFVILTFFGVWSFCRGVMLLYSMGRSDNKFAQQGHVGMAGVYIVAGVLLANAKMSTCFILNTVGGASMAAGFCV